MPVTRQQERAMAELDSLKQLLEKIAAGQAAMKEEMKAGQEEMKKKIESAQEEMKTGQDSVRKEIISVKDALQEKLLVVENRMNAVEDKVTKIEGDINRKIKENFEEKFSEMEDKVIKIEENIEKKIKENFEQEFAEKFQSIESKVKKIEENYDKKLEESIVRDKKNIQEEHVAEVTSNRPHIKPSTYDGKTSWTVYKTQFSIVAEANGWDSRMKASHLAASLRGDAADILGVLTEEERMNFESLSKALELRFGEKCLKDYSRLQLKTRQQKITETLQELATDIERLAHHAYPDCPSEVRENLSMMHFIDAVKDAEIQKALRLADLKDLKSALVYAMKVESAQQASRKDRHPIRAAKVENGEFDVAKLKELFHEIIREHSRKFNSNKSPKKPVKCWNCGAEGHFRKDCDGSQNREKALVKPNQGN